MKKILSLILCLATIFSSVAFCVPAIAADIDFGVETGEDQETLPDKRRKTKPRLRKTSLLSLSSMILKTVLFRQTLHRTIPKRLFLSSKKAKGKRYRSL